MQHLKSSPQDRVRMGRCYTVGQTAVLLQLAHSSVIRMIDRGELAAYRLPNPRGDRRILHRALISFVRRNPGFRFALQNLSGYHAGDDFPESDEPLPTPAQHVRFAPPRSAHRPRSAVHGKIPKKCTYSASEIAFVLGLSRRSVISKLESRVIIGAKVPWPGSTLSSWRWIVSRGAFLAFLERHPEYSFARKRIGGRELSGDNREGPKKTPADSRLSP
jgi:hypothetical protein